MITFTVYGHPEPAGSKKAFAMPGGRGARVVDANPKSKDWKAAVSREAALATMGMDLIEGPIVATFVFYRLRPKSHYRANGKLRPAAPQYHTTTPDALKLARGVEDALTGIVYRDDSQIVEEIVFKRYGNPERVEITVCQINATPCQINATPLEGRKERP